MRQLPVLTLILLALGPQPVLAQSPDDSLGIRNAALDYIQGWYAADGDRMAQALHPELAKRIMYSDTLGNVWISNRADRCRRLDRLPASRALARAMGHSQCALGGSVAAGGASLIGVPV